MKPRAEKNMFLKKYNYIVSKEKEKFCSYSRHVDNFQTESPAALDLNDIM